MKIRLSSWTGLNYVGVFVFFITTVQCQESMPKIIAAGEIIEKIQNPSIKDYMQKELNKILTIQDESSKSAAIEKFLQNLNINDNKPTASDNANIIMDLEKEIEAINMLTKYACLLYDLEGKGSTFVRKELIDNLNTTGLSKETISLMRQLIAVLDEAEKTLKSITYIQEDNSQESAEMWANNIGGSVGMSIAIGDPTPLIGGVISGIRGQTKLNKEKNRTLNLFIQNHQSRITNFLFNVNLRRSELEDTRNIDHKLFITKENYDAFKLALVMTNRSQKAAALINCYSICPNLREALYYLLIVYDSDNNIEESEKYCQKLIDSPSRVLRNDGLLGFVYYVMSDYRIQLQKYQEAVDFATKALKYQPNLDVAYNSRSIAFMYLNNHDKALEDIKKAIELNPSKGLYYWTLSMMFAYRNDEDTALSFLHIAVQLGFCDFVAVRGFTPIQKALKSQRGRSILEPALYAKYAPGIVNDDIIVYNAGYYPLTNVKIILELTYPDVTNSGKNRISETIKKIKSIDGQRNYSFKNVLSIAKSSWCEIKITMTCDQFPEEEFIYVYIYNSLGSDHKTISHAEYLNYNASDIFLNKRKDQYDNAYKMASDAVSWTYEQEHNFLNTKARLAYELGRKDEARNHESLAIKIIKRDYSNDAEKLQEYESTLNGFK